jgi:hypothetical protein
VKSLKLCLALSIALFAASPVLAQLITPNVSGYVVWGGAGGGPAAANVLVRLCTTPNPPAYPSSSTCTTVTSNSAGYYSSTTWQVGVSSTIYFFPYIDRMAAGGRTGQWGSRYVSLWSTPACKSKNQFGACNNWTTAAPTLTVNPRPLEPVAINPAPNAINVGWWQTFKWTNSSDSWRTGSNIVYDIYGSGYDAPLLLQASGLPCNPDANNHCQWTLPIQLTYSTPYNWQIIARANSYNYETASQVYHFHTSEW